MEYTVQETDLQLLAVRGTKEIPEELQALENPLRSYCLLYSAGGKFEVLWEQKHVFVPEHSAFLFLPGYCYTVCSASKNLQLIDLRFNLLPLAASAAQKKAEASAQATHFSDYSLFNTPTLLSIPQKCRHNLEAILWEYPKNDLFSQKISELYCKITLLSLLRESVASDGDCISETAEKIMSYVREHITESLQNEVASKALSYHPNYINRVIKKATGMTFHKYVVDEKLRYAATQLLSTNDSITEIAYSLSFNTSSHFSNLFAEKYQCTPSQYRKRRP